MAEVREVRVPDLGDFEDVPVIEIFVAPGDHVEPETALLTIESDKATMDVPSPFAGTVMELKVAVNDTVSQGDVLLTLEAAGDEPAQTPAEEPETPAPPEPAPEPESESESDASVYAGPSVRRLARERGVDLSSVQGSGPKGRILAKDLDGATAGTASGDGGLGLAPWPTIDFARYGEIERVPLSKVRKTAGSNLLRNWVRIPHVTHHELADVTELEAFRKATNTDNPDIKVTLVALLLAATAATLRAFPEFNSSLDGDELVLKRYFHLGFAVDTPGGLVVPVVRDVDKKGVLELASELAELSGKAREGKLGPAEMSGATFTISSLGGIGGTGFTPIINAPEVAILGVSRTSTQPVWDGEEFRPRLKLPLSLSYDHRAIDGAAAARFCVHLASLLGDLRRILL